MSWENEYPRPQLVRGNYQIIHEGWTLNGLPIKMPFPPEAKASEYEGEITGKLSYLVKFQLEREPKKEKILLHFGAVDQTATVFVNSMRVGSHEGGYIPFTCDITSAAKVGENLLRVEAFDDGNRLYPYGKQSKKPHGMWYTPVSGIWQQVWLEYVPEDGITDLRIHTTMTELRMKPVTTASMLVVTISDRENNVLRKFQTADKKIVVNFRELNLPIHLWSPEDPYLYGLTLETENDKVESYFALRELSIQEYKGYRRFFLNDRPIFLQGVLDQGYFEEGIYLPARPEDYDEDVLCMKELGMNTLRKHIKVEPERFYYACDRLGMLVIQDMVNNGGYNFLFDTALPNIGLARRHDRFPWGKKYKRVFERHSIGIIRKVRNHPCVIGYTIFNEGWGQFEADRVYDLLKREDPTKVFDATSGWFRQKKSDVDSRHVYFKNKLLTAKDKPLLLSECGGYTRSIEGHLYRPDVKYGYGDTSKQEELMARMESLYWDMVLPSIGKGLCGCIYTQLSDVETEINGLYTYDRLVCKVDKDKMQSIATRLQNELK